MPVKIKKVKGKYQVSTPSKVHAKGTTLEKAEAQKRLLNALEHGWKPTHHSANDGNFLVKRKKQFGV